MSPTALRFSLACLSGLDYTSRAHICKPFSSPEIDSQPGGIDSLELVPELLKRLQIQGSGILE